MKTTYGLILAALLACTSAAADETARREKVAAIVEAQGLHQMFQQQLDQGLASAGELGRGIVRKIAQETGMSDAEAKSKLEPIFRRYMERCATMFTARELVDIWARTYGRDLSEPELDQVLAYYKSAIGKKDVASSKKSMSAFSQTMNSLGQERLNESLGQLMRDLKEVARK
jgi:hypothetical protein